MTGLLYYNFRYYDPVSGRFVRADTVDTNASGMDPYAYVGDSPENKADPTGHDGGNLGDPVAQAYVEAWYAEIETDSAVVVDQPADMHNSEWQSKMLRCQNGMVV